MSVGLTLICHASTSAVREVAFAADEPLDPQGHAKASALVGQLRRVDAAWCSPALRAMQTAAALQLQAEVNPMLRDLDLGRWAGRSFADVQQTEPDGIAAWLSESDAAPHGGESIIGLLERIADWLDVVKRADGLDAVKPADGLDAVKPADGLDAVKRADGLDAVKRAGGLDAVKRADGLDAVKRQDGRLVAVTHPAVIRAAIVLAIDAKPTSFWRIDIAPLCHVRLQGNAGRWTLRSIIP